MLNKMFLLILGIWAVVGGISGRVLGVDEDEQVLSDLMDRTSKALNEPDQTEQRDAVDLQGLQEELARDIEKRMRILGMEKRFRAHGRDIEGAEEEQKSQNAQRLDDLRDEEKRMRILGTEKRITPVGRNIEETRNEEKCPKCHAQRVENVQDEDKQARPLGQNIEETRNEEKCLKCDARGVENLRDEDKRHRPLGRNMPEAWMAMGKRRILGMEKRIENLEKKWQQSLMKRGYDDREELADRRKRRYPFHPLGF